MHQKYLWGVQVLEGDLDYFSLLFFTLDFCILIMIHILFLSMQPITVPWIYKRCTWKIFPIGASGFCSMLEMILITLYHYAFCHCPTNCLTVVGLVALYSTNNTQIITSSWYAILFEQLNENIPESIKKI